MAFGKHSHIQTGGHTQINGGKRCNQTQPEKQHTQTHADSMAIYRLLSRHQKIKAYHSTLIFFSLFPSQLSSLFPLISPSLILFSLTFFYFLSLFRSINRPHFTSSLPLSIHLHFFLPPVPSYLQLPFTFSLLTLNLSIANPFCLPLFFYQSFTPPFLHLLCIAPVSAQHTAAPVLSVISQNGSWVARNYIRSSGGTYSMFYFYVCIFLPMCKKTYLP